MPIQLDGPVIRHERTLEDLLSESLRQFVADGHLFELLGLVAALVFVLTFIGSSPLERASLPRRWRYAGLVCALAVFGLGAALGRYIKPTAAYDIALSFERRPSLLIETAKFTNKTWTDVALLIAVPAAIVVSWMMRSHIGLRATPLVARNSSLLTRFHKSV